MKDQSVLKVFIIDKQKIFREGLRSFFLSVPEIHISGAAASYKELLDNSKNLFDHTIIFDLSIQPEQAIPTLQKIKTSGKNISVLTVGTFPEKDNLAELFQAGADGYIEKTASLEEMLLAVRKVASGGTYIDSQHTERLIRQLNEKAKHQPHDVLTLREIKVMLGIASGRKLKQIAEELGISGSSVSYIRKDILQKLNFQRNDDLVT